MTHQHTRTNSAPQSNPNPNSGLIPTSSRTSQRTIKTMMKRTTIMMLLSTVIGLLASPVNAATLLPPGKSCFADENGAPLAAGAINFYIPATTTPKNTYQDAASTVLNTNPVVLDSAGCAIIYGDGTYREIIKDSLGNLVWDQLTESTGNGTGVVLYGGTSTGSANAQIISVAGFTATDGQLVSFIAGFTNTGPTTIDAGTGGIAVRYDSSSGPIALVGGEIRAGNAVVALYVGGLFHLIDAPPPTTYYYGALWGLTISNNVADATNDIDVAVGNAASNTSNVMMVLTGPLTKQLDNPWVVGNNAGCRDTGAIANGTWHVYLIERVDTSVEDILCSASAVTPTMPTNYTLNRRIGSILREGGVIVPFFQTGDIFLRKVPLQDYSTTNPGPNAQTWTTSVPTGIVVNALVAALIADATPAADAFMWISSIAQTDTVPSGAAFSLSSPASGAGVPSRVSGEFSRPTNTSAQIRYRVAGSTADFVITGITYGWVDTRGRLN